jgi:hypothetical protein
MDAYAPECVALCRGAAHELHAQHEAVRLWGAPPNVARDDERAVLHVPEENAQIELRSDADLV